MVFTAYNEIEVCFKRKFETDPYFFCIRLAKAVEMYYNISGKKEITEVIMKQKYTIRVAGVEMNVISEESPEAVEALVGIVDRKMREITEASRNCSKTEAALLCALDYCSERIKTQRRIKTLESKLALAESELEEIMLENEELRRAQSQAADGN